MAFDLSTAKPESGFDLETAKPSTGDEVIINDVGIAEGVGQSLLQGSTLGFADEVQASVAALAASPFVKDKSFGDLREEALSSFRGEREAFKEENPGISLASEIAGGLVTGGSGLAKLGAAKGGALLGAAAGAGFSDSDEFFSGDTLKDAAIGSATGAIGGKAGEKLFKLGRSALARNAKLKNILKTEPDARVAKYILDGAGKVKKDPKAITAINTGVDESIVSVVKGSSGTDKTKMLKMLNILKKGQRDARFAATNRANDVVGDSVLQRFNVVKDANRKAASQLDEVANSLKGQGIEIDDAVNVFVDDLNDIGVSFNKLKPTYKNSDIEGLKDIQSVVNRVVARMANTKTPDAYDVHRMKRFIDEQVSFGKSAKGLGGKVEGILKSLRRNLDQTLDSNFDQYNQVNTVYAQTRSVLDDFQKAAGSKINLKGENANAAVGTLSRRMLSNAQSRVEIMDVVKNLQDVAEANGGKFDDDIISQLVFSDELSRLFGSSAKTSFQGEIEKATKMAVDTAIEGPAGVGRSLLKRVLAKSGNNLDKEKLFTSLESLLSE